MSSRSQRASRRFGQHYHARFSPEQCSSDSRDRTLSGIRTLGGSERADVLRDGSRTALGLGQRRHGRGYLPLSGSGSGQLLFGLCFGRWTFSTRRISSSVLRIVCCRACSISFVPNWNPHPTYATENAMIELPSSHCSAWCLPPRRV